ncbi:uncharacterized protein LOC124700509 [Lolium rigidum]|uniref:uncharacterized protein LOC124700509 n=1 Tax=Lolium rigidum TaxID=89674 RepID=UPI001F5D33ED|nr:uncharacterized protein LOC124700509 [Lolium rigidum]
MAVSVSGSPVVLCSHIVFRFRGLGNDLRRRDEHHCITDHWRASRFSGTAGGHVLGGSVILRLMFLPAFIYGRSQLPPGYPATVPNSLPSPNFASLNQVLLLALCDMHVVSEHQVGFMV